MVYKKYIKRGDKKYGPYVYHSKKYKGKVITEYLGKHKGNENTRGNNSIFGKLIVFVVIAMLFVLGIVIFTVTFPESSNQFIQDLLRVGQEPLLAPVQYTGCSDPLLDWAGQGYTSCVDVTTCGITFSPNTYYLLSNDITSDGTCFDVDVSNVAIDLNNYTLTFSNKFVPDAVNYNFEAGSTGWDLSGAPSASVTSVIPQPKGYWHQSEVGLSSLKFTNPSASDVVYSSPLSLEVGRNYTISYLINAYQPDAGNIFVGLNTTLVDGLSGCESSYTANDGAGSRGSSAYYDTEHSSLWGAAGGSLYAQNGAYLRCIFTVTETNPKLKIHFKGAVAGDIYLDAIEIKPADEDGVGTVGFNVDNLRVTNGRIIQGTKSYYSNALDFRYGSGYEADNLYIEVGGPDASGVYTFKASGVNIHDNTINHLVNRTHLSHSGIWSGNAISGEFLSHATIYNNNITRASSGISLLNKGTNATIYNNSINIVNNAIHSYAFGARGNENDLNKKRDDFTFHDNFINNTRGSGIFLDVGSSNGTLYNNHIEIRDGPQEERAWTGKAIWQRSASGGFKIYNNTFIAYGGLDFPRPGENTSLAVVRIGGYTTQFGPVEFYDNVVEAHTPGGVFVQTSPTVRFVSAAAIDISTDKAGGVSWTPKIIYNNTFESDHWVASFANQYAAGVEALFVSNTFIKSPNAHPIFKTMYMGGGGSQPIKAITLLDTKGVNGADVHDFDTYFLNSPLDMDIDWYLDTFVKYSNGVPVPNADVKIYDVNNVLVRSGKSDANGVYRTNLTEMHLGGTTASIIYTNSSPYKVSVNIFGVEQNVTVNLNTSQNVTFIVAAGIPFASNTECEINTPGNWMGCGNLSYNDNLLQVRALCNDTDGTITKANFTLKNIEDNKFIAQGEQIGSGVASEVITIDFADVSVNDSGNFDFMFFCFDDGTNFGAEVSSWFVPWGSLNVVHNSPPSGSEYSNGTIFSYSTTLNCNGGECGDVTAILDPQLELSSATGDVLEDTYSRPGAGASFDESSFGIVTGFNNANPYSLWLKFDLTSIPVDSVLSNATIRLYHYADLGTHTGANFSVYGVLDQGWSETLCFDSTINCPLIDNELSTGIIPGGVDGETYWQDLPISNITWFQQQIDSGLSNVTFMINRTGGAGTQNWDQYRDREYVDPAFGPKLVLDFVDPHNKGGVIPMNSGNPFYTTSQNPTTCNNMIGGDSCTTTWNVFANGTETWYNFFVIYNATNPAVTDVNSSLINISIGAGAVGKQLPLYNSFDGSTTNFSLESNLSNVTNSVLEKTSFGKIEFGAQSLDFDGLNLDSYVFIEDKLIGIDTINLPGLNTPSTITFYNIGFTNPKVLNDGVDCVACSIVSYIGNNLVVSVPGFSNYTVVGNTQLSIWDETDTITKFPDDSIISFANYTNFTSSLPVTGATCNINFGAGNTAMNYNAVTGLYENISSFASAGTYPYTINCSAVGYDNLELSDSVLISTPVATCDLTNASWSQTNVLNGTLVDLITVGSNCVGEQINFTIWEFDPLNADDYVQSTIAVYDRTSWISLYLPEGGLDPTPEYYFTAILVSNTSESVNSKTLGNPLLQVSLPSVVNDVFVNPVNQSVNQSDNFTVEIRARAPFGSSDIYSLQYDVLYNSSILTFVNITEGTMLNNNGQDVTFFNYNASVPGLIKDIYIARNGTTGVYNDENITAIINFTAINSGISFIDLNNLIWVNSTITNQSAGIPNVNVANGSVNVTFSGSPVCGNGVVEGIEVCDSGNLSGQTCISQGFIGGILTCDASCLSFNLTQCISPPVLTPQLISPISDINVNQNEFFTFTTNVTCTGGNCGNVTAILDPLSDDTEWIQLYREDFNGVYNAVDGQTFGTDNWLTYQLISRGAGNAEISVNNGYAFVNTSDWWKAALIHSTNTLPDEYKIRTRIGYINYDYTNYDAADIANETFYNQSENGIYFLTITDELCSGIQCEEVWWHYNRKMVIDVDDHAGEPAHPLYMIYMDPLENPFPSGNILRPWDGATDSWITSGNWNWNRAYTYDYNTWYVAEMEKKAGQMILRLYNETDILLEETTPVSWSLVSNSTVPDYLYVGEPHTDDYEGNARIDYIELLVPTTQTYSCGAACLGTNGCTDSILGPACTVVHQCDGGNTVEDIHVQSSGGQNVTPGETINITVDYECWDDDGLLPGASTDEVTIWYYNSTGWRMIYNVDVSQSGNCDPVNDGTDGSVSTNLTIDNILGLHTIRVFETDWDSNWNQETSFCPTATGNPFGDFDDIQLLVKSGASAKGQVSTIIGATPFYTTNLNPQSCGIMVDGQTCTTTWQVNATGNVGGMYGFFTTYSSNDSNIVDVKTTPNININITQTGISDTTPPIRSNGLPIGALSAGTNQTTISLTTDEPSTCKYDTTPGIAYASMLNTFTTTGSTSHSSLVTGLVDGSAYNYYVRCIDVNSNANSDDFGISFSVSSAVDNNPSVTLNSPADGLITNQTSINFNASVSDDNGIVNVSLFIDGVRDQTDISGLNNVDYIFNKVFTNGTYVWNYEACDSASQCINSIARSLTINTTIIDNIPPSFTNLANQTLVSGQSLNYNIDATDAQSNVSCFTVNDTVNFAIDCSGILTNTTTGLNPGIYWLTVSVNDTFNNVNTGEIYVNVTTLPIPPTVIITSPTNNSVLSVSDVDVVFNLNNWSVLGKGQNHIHFYLNNDPIAYMFYNGLDNVTEYNFLATSNTSWISSNTIRFNNLNNGSYSVRAVLADALHTELVNPEAQDIVSFNVSTVNTCTNGLQDGDEAGVDCGGSCSNACTSSSGGGPSGGGGGGSTTPATSFSIDNQQISLTLEQGDDTSASFTVTNDGTKNLDFTVSNELTNMVHLINNNFTLASKESKTVFMNIFTDENTSIDLYADSISVQASSVKKEVLLSLEVVSQGSLFDIVLEIPDEDLLIQPGGELDANLSLTRLVGTAGDNVTLNYIIKDEEGNEVFFEKGIKVIGTSLSFIKQLALPADMAFGKYVLYVQVDYQDKVASSSIWFDVGEDKKGISKISEFIKLNAWRLVAFILSLTAIVIVTIVYVKARKERNMIEQSFTARSGTHSTGILPTRG